MALFVAAGGEDHERTLKELYDSFYEKLPALQIMDCKDQVAEDLTIDGFICGFPLAWKLSRGLNMYDEGRFALTDEVKWNAL